MARANAFWPAAVVCEADSVNSMSASACHIGGPNSVNPGQILLVYGKNCKQNLQVGFEFNKEINEAIMNQKAKFTFFIFLTENQRMTQPSAGKKYYFSNKKLFYTPGKTGYKIFRLAPSFLISCH